jgi:hypothetical protein
MPVIPTERIKRQVRVNPLVLLGIMAFPKDEEKRRLFLASFHRFAAGEIETRIRKLPEAQDYPVGPLLGELLGRALEPLGGFPALDQAPSFSEVVRQLADRAWPGSIAGDVLNYLLQMKAAGYQASVNKAVALSEAFLGEAMPRMGPPGGKSNRYIRQAWEDFKPVSHLWAAFRLLEDEDLGAVGRTEAKLALSRLLLDLALTIRPKGGREPLLRADELWQVPRRYRHQQIVVKFTIPPLEEWQLQVLRDYKPRSP